MNRILITFFIAVLALGAQTKKIVVTGQPDDVYPRLAVGVQQGQGL